MEETVHGHREAVSDASDRSEGVRPRAEVRDFPQIFEGVALRLQRIGVRILDLRADVDTRVFASRVVFPILTSLSLSYSKMIGVC